MADNRTEASTVLITGAGQRIGRALAIDFASHGWQVAINYATSKKAAEALVAEIEAAGGRAAAIRADLANSEELETLIPACQAQLGPPLCLVNNASIFEHDDIASLDEESWRRHLSVNLRAPVFLAQAFAAALPPGAKGNIINIVDQRVWRLTPHFFSYTISKSGLWTATRTLALALAPDIRVNAIGPGPTLPSSRQTEASFELQRRATPLGHGPQLDEICRAARFILDAPSMTGQMIALDGGQHLAWETPDILAGEE